MTASKKINTFLEQKIAEGNFPSAVYLVADKGRTVFHGAAGSAVVEPETIAAETSTIYDLASLTKPLVTGLLCAKLVENGELEIERAVAYYLPQFDTNDKREVTVSHLLTHTSGFEAWKPFYLLVQNGNLADVVDLIAKTPLNCPPGTKVIYSDLNFLTLSLLIENICGDKLDRVAAAEIFAPLNLEKTSYNPPAEWKKHIAANERGNGYEKNTCAESGYDVSKFAWRENVIWGEVHDGNAHFLGGVAGHAGLFSNAEETSRIARQFLAETTEILRPETCLLFHRNFTLGTNEARSFAFQLAATEKSAAGDALAADSFGHLGFTGTSLWIEPATQRVFILLTNRTHAHELPFVILNSIRREFHSLAVGELNAA